MNLINPGHEGLTPLVGDITNKVVVLDWHKLNRRYQMPRFQLIKAKGGFGCREAVLGSKVFGICVADGEDVTTRREHLIGIATDDLIVQAMADSSPVKPIDLSLREYMVVAKDGTSARGHSIEEARHNLKLHTNANVSGAYEVHPESYINDLGFISYPEGAPPAEVRIRKGKIWTAAH